MRARPQFSAVFSLLVSLALAACGGGGGSSGPAPVPPTVQAVPAAPTGIVVTAGNNSVSISWGAVAGATSFNIYRSATQGQLGTRVGSSSTTPYVDTTALNGTTYYYQVTAVNAAGESLASLQSAAATPTLVVVVPTAPTGVTAVRSLSQVSVSWSAVAGASMYKLYRSTTQGTRGIQIGASATLS